MPQNEAKVTIFRGLLLPGEKISQFDWWNDATQLTAPADKPLYVELQAVPQKVIEGGPT